MENRGRRDHKEITRMGEVDMRDRKTWNGWILFLGMVLELHY